MQATLLRIIVLEPALSVRKMEAALIGRIARTAVPADAWPQLLPRLHQCCMSTEAQHKAIGLAVLTAMMEQIGMCHLNAEPSIRG